MNTEEKNHLLEYCERHVEDKLERIQSEIERGKQALNGESKSSAGDKHETARAMAQLEMEKAGQRYSQVLPMRLVCRQIRANFNSSEESVVRLGSLVRSGGKFYFLAISLVLVNINSQKYIVISPKSPLGAGLIGKTIGDLNSFNGEKIEEIFN
jgi:hypothetical protein